MVDHAKGWQGRRGWACITSHRARQCRLV